MMAVIKSLRNIGNNKGQLLKDSFWAVFGNAIGKGLLLLAGIAVARFLGRDSYGEYGLIRNTILTIGIFSTFGIGYTATKFISQGMAKFPDRIFLIYHILIKITLIASIVISALIFTFARQLAVFLENAPLATAIRMCAIIIVFNALTFTQNAILCGFKEFKKVAINNGWSGIVTFVSSASLAYWYGFDGALYALLISQLFNSIINYISIRSITTKINKVVIPVQEKKKIQKEIIIFSFPIALHESLYFVITWFFNFVIIKFADYGQLGLYNAACQWTVVILYIPSVLRNVTLSYLTSTANLSTEQEILKMMILSNFATSSVMCLIIMLLSGYIEGFYGVSFVGLRVVLCTLSLSTIFDCVGSVYEQGLISKAKNWSLLSVNSIKNIGTIILAIVLIHNMAITGALGLSISRVAFSCMVVPALVYCYNNKNIRK